MYPAMTMDSAQDPAVVALTTSQPPATSTATAAAATSGIASGAQRRGTRKTPVTTTKTNIAIHCAPEARVQAKAMTVIVKMSTARRRPCAGATAPRTGSATTCRCAASTAATKQAAKSTSAPPASQAGRAWPPSTSEAGPARASRKM